MSLGWRTLRRRVVETVRDLDDAVLARLPRRPRVLFEARTPVNFVCLKPMHDALAADPRLECWYTATDGDFPAEDIYGRFGITERIVPARRAEFMKWDLYLNSDFYRMVRLRRRARQVTFFHGVAGKYDLDGTRTPVPVGNGLQVDMWYWYAQHIERLDRIAFVNEDRLRKWREAGILAPDDPRPALIGYPKVDGLVTGRWSRADTLARLGLDPARPVLLYAPTWSPDASHHAFGEAVIAALRSTGHQLIVKLHDRSYDPRERYSGGVDWTSRLGRLAASDAGLRVVTEPDACPLLTAADLMVSDHSSVAFEFLLVDRPLVILDLPALLKTARVHPDQARWLREAGEPVAGPADLPAAVARGLADPAARSAARRAVASRLFYDPGRATERAVALCYELLGLGAEVGAGPVARPRYAVAARGPRSR
jgi:hypothetical protein